MIAESITKHNEIISSTNPLKDLVDKDRRKEKQMRRLIHDCEVMSSSSDETLNHAHYIGATGEEKAEGGSSDDGGAQSSSNKKRNRGRSQGPKGQEDEVPVVKTRFEKIAENNMLVAKSNESFIKKAGQIMAKAHILQELLDTVY